MRQRTFFCSRRREQGLAAVEFAIVLPVLVILLASVLFLSRYFWHYTVLQKAARDGALYLASAPRIELTAAGGVQVPAADVAVAIMRAEMADLYPGGEVAKPALLCRVQVTTSPSSATWVPCNGMATPVDIKADIWMYMTDPFFGELMWQLGGDRGLLVVADVTVPYVGN